VSHIVQVAAGRTGPLNSSFELSRRLTEAGHTITYVSHDDIQNAVTAQGFAFRRIVRDQEFVARMRELGGPWKGGARVTPASLTRWVHHRRQIRRDSAAQTEVEEVMTELAPDLILAHVEAHFVILASLSLGIPMALVCSWFSVYRSPEHPPLHSSLGPGTSFLSRLAVRRAWSWARVYRLRQEWWHRVTAARMGWLRPVPYSSTWVDDLRPVARAKGVDASTDLDRSHWLRPWVYTKLPLLSFNLEELEFPGRRPAQLRYVGPMVARDRTEVAVRGPGAEAWRALEARRASSARPRPLVYCALGSYWTADLGFLRRVMQAFAARPQWDVVMGLGQRVDRAALEPVPGHVLCMTWAPQLKVLAQAQCALIHGGVNSVNECLAFGVPMALYSVGTNDQNGTAARVAFHGLGVTGDKDRDSAEAIAANLDQALTDSAMRERVLEIRDRIVESERSGLAVRTVESFLHRPA
jgi:UDP:flavonoid glycosyltransferase YjiC (YdhE family)